MSKLISYKDFNPKLNKFTEFVYVKDAKHTLKHYNLNFKGKKGELVARLIDFFKKINQYEKHEEKIIKLQSCIKGYTQRKRALSRGPGFINKSLCNNDEDFFTFEHKNDIDNTYFFSYKDVDNFIYFFDIRSFKTLIENKEKNPYNRKPIPEEAIKSMNTRLNELIKQKIIVEYEKPKLTPEQEFNNKVLTIFQKIDQLNAFAGGTQINWFHNLTFKQIKHLYKVLEDIWNYRTQLTEKQKRDIVPENNMFKHSMSSLMNLLPNQKNQKKLKNIVLDEIDKLISSSESKVHRSTGCYYVLIALVEVSPECADQMPWLIQV